MVGVRGFEPPASASRTQRSSQTEPHPDLNSVSSQFPALFHNIVLIISLFKPIYVKKRVFYLISLNKSQNSDIFTEVKRIKIFFQWSKT